MFTRPGKAFDVSKTSRHADAMSTRKTSSQRSTQVTASLTKNPTREEIDYPLVIYHFAIENGTCSSLIYLLRMVIFYSYVTVYQRANKLPENPKDLRISQELHRPRLSAPNRFPKSPRIYSLDPREDALGPAFCLASHFKVYLRTSGSNQWKFLDAVTVPWKDDPIDLVIQQVEKWWFSGNTMGVW